MSQQQLNESLAVFLINDQVRGIRVSYNIKGKTAAGEDVNDDPAKTYFFKTFHQNLSVDDLIVVPSRGNNGAVPFTVVRVSEINAKPPYKQVDIDFKWIVGGVDINAYTETQEKEQKLFDLMEEKREVAAINELRKLIRTEDDADDYDGLAIASTVDALPAPEDVPNTGEYINTTGEGATKSDAGWNESYAARRRQDRLRSDPSKPTNET
jgi:hypothetical protein